MTEHRRCPRDSTRLDARTVGPGWRFHLCATCHGLWVSGPDLQAFLASRTDSLKLPAGDDRPHQLPPPDDAVRCACDAAAMMTTLRHGRVKIDVCPACQAVWLDGGELDALTGDTRAGHDGAWALDVLQVLGDLLSGVFDT